MRKIFTLLVFLSMFYSVHAITDTFTDYSNSSLVLTDTNVLTGWTIASDANTPIAYQPLIGKAAIRVPVDVSLNADNNAGISRNLNQNYSITDYNATGRIYTMIFLDSNATFTSVTMRLGQNSSKYWQWVNTAPYGDTFYFGKNLVSFDFNSASTTVGSPTSDINFLQLIFTYQAGQGDFNVMVDRVWLEKQNNAFNGTWVIQQSGAAPQGWAIPFSYPEGTGMSLTDINKTSLGNHGRVFFTPLNDLDLSDYDLNYSIDLNQVDTNWGTRMLFDVVNFAPGDNFSSCFLFDATATSRRVGVEQWENGVRTFSQSTLTMNYNDYNTMRCITSGLTVTIYMNGNLVHTGTLNSRVDGRLGLETFGGITHIKNFSIGLTETGLGGIDNAEIAVYISQFNVFSNIQSLLVLIGIILTLSVLGFLYYSMSGQGPNISMAVNPSDISGGIIYLGIAALVIFFLTIIGAMILSV